MAPAGMEHGVIVWNLTGRLSQHVSVHRLGVGCGAETGFVIRRDPDTVRAPDLAFISRARLPHGGIPQKFCPIAPDLVVEVLSPSDTVYEVEEKVQDWLAAGVRLVWVINPRRRAALVHRPGAAVESLDEGGWLEGGDVLPGFRCRVGDALS